MLAKKILLMPTIASTAIIGLTTGCTSTGYKYPGHPVIVPSSTIQLKFSAEFPTDYSKIYIQNGAVISKNAKDRYQTYCTLSTKPGENLATEKSRVSPGTFTVTKIRLYNDYVHDPVVYASTDLDFYHPGGGVNYRTELYLLSDDQPIVRDLSCTNYNPDYSRRGFYPVKAEFVKALGKLVKF